MIAVDRVSFGYQAGIEVLSEITLELLPGLTLVLGPNGSGKSTLLKLAAGVERPIAGRVRVAGHDLWRDEAAARRHLAYVPEHPDLTPYATVREILELVCGLRSRPVTAADEALAWAGLDRLGDRTVRELSKGQRRRATLAAARIRSPSCLLLDEPLEGMDRGFRAELVSWLGSRLAAGSTVVVASHDLEPFAAEVDRVVTFDGGRCRLEDALPPLGTARWALLEELATGRRPRR